MRAIVTTLRGAVAEAAANRAALWSQITVMVLNDVVWIVFWVLFFRRVGSIRGWDTERILLLLSILTTAAGIALGVFSNARRVGSMAVDGHLDAVLSLPVPPLAYLLVRRIEPTNFGDITFGVVLFAVAGEPTVRRTAVFVVVVAAVVALVTGFLVLTGSLAFFVGRSAAGELGFQALLMLGSYPVDVFAGLARVVLYSVVPAAFVSSVPAQLVDDLDLLHMAWLAATATAFASAGWLTFTLGLRRYASGSIWTRA
jgi:ABC-2 type transport system permease protein